MKLTLIRTFFGKEFTDGELWVDGKFFCFTVEDKVRAKRGFWDKLLKIYGRTAIPYGEYPVLVTWSNKFKRMLTEILRVPDFFGIRMHNGTSERSSSGCIIMSRKRIKPGQLLNDKVPMDELCEMVKKAQTEGKIYIEIKDK